MSILKMRQISRAARLVGAAFSLIFSLSYGFRSMPDAGVSCPFIRSSDDRLRRSNKTTLTTLSAVQNHPYYAILFHRNGVVEQRGLVSIAAATCVASAVVFDDFTDTSATITMSAICDQRAPPPADILSLKPPPSLAALQQQTR